MLSFKDFIRIPQDAPYLISTGFPSFDSTLTPVSAPSFPFHIHLETTPGHQSTYLSISARKLVVRARLPHSRHVTVSASLRYRQSLQNFHRSGKVDGCQTYWARWISPAVTEMVVSLLPVFQAGIEIDHPGPAPSCMSPAMLKAVIQYF